MNKHKCELSSTGCSIKDSVTGRVVYHAPKAVSSVLLSKDYISAKVDEWFEIADKKINEYNIQLMKEIIAGSNSVYYCEGNCACSGHCINEQLHDKGFTKEDFDNAMDQLLSEFQLEKVDITKEDIKTKDEKYLISKLCNIKLIDNELIHRCKVGDTSA